MCRPPASSQVECEARVLPQVRKGILPEILAALMTARAATRQALKGVVEPGARAVLESRQKALKLTANALYGFTGRAHPWHLAT
jgi:DNA polymerase delta subunit 1